MDHIRKSKICIAEVGEQERKLKMAEPIKWITVGGRHVPIFEDTVPSKESIDRDVKKLKGKALQEAINRADSLGDYYREDKRQKKGYIEGIVSNYKDNPSSMLEIEMNQDIVYIVKNISTSSKEMAKMTQEWIKRRESSDGKQRT